MRNVIGRFFDLFVESESSLEVFARYSFDNGWVGSGVTSAPGNRVKSAPGNRVKSGGVGPQGDQSGAVPQL